MKRLIVILSVLLLAAGSANAQSILRNIGERAKKAVEEKVGEKVEQAVGSAIDKATSKKDKKGEAAKEESAAPEVAAPVEAAEPAPAAAPQAKSVETGYAKSDFVPGDEIFFDDPVENEKIGEYPSHWDFIGGEECEIMTLTHHVKKVAEVLEKAEVKLLYLPPYSPDFNPIEKSGRLLHPAGEERGAQHRQCRGRGPSDSE